MVIGVLVIGVLVNGVSWLLGFWLLGFWFMGIQDVNEHVFDQWPSFWFFGFGVAGVISNLVNRIILNRVK